MTPPAPTPPPITASSSTGVVATVDHLASAAGAQLLATGGSAADAAVGANAVLAVTAPHLCGMGGDLFAVVHQGSGPPQVLDAAGRAGSGADPERLRAAGHRTMPLRGDVASVPVPGCVDGWVALLDRHGRLPLAEVLAPARRLAADGFPVSPLLAFMLHTLGPLVGCDELAVPRPDTGERLARPDLAATLDAVAAGGRDAFYGGAFGAGLVELGAGEYTAADLAEPQARWRDPLRVRVWGHDLWAPPPTSSGYLVLAGAAVAERAAAGPWPHPDDAAWAHRVVEAARLAGHDRPEVLHEHAEAAALVDPARLAALAARFDPERAAAFGAPPRPGGTTYLCAVDAEGMGVSLIQSNAKDFGAHLAVPGTGVLLHDRGIGFSLEPGHPAEYGPGRRPPHTLAPALLTRPDGSLRAVLGTMGGDAQPQVVLQLVARLLVAGEDPGRAVAAPRAVVAAAAGGTGFDSWEDPDDQVVRIEAHAPADWEQGLARRGHRVLRAGFDPGGFGHAQCIEVRDDGVRVGAADPRALVAAVVAAP